LGFLEAPTFIALLRGINVGGKNIVKMEHLKQIFGEMGFFDVKTYIQRGALFLTRHSQRLRLTWESVGVVTKRHCD